MKIKIASHRRDWCLKDFPTKYNRSHHVAKCNAKRPATAQVLHSCSKCKKVFPNKFNLTRHTGSCQGPSVVPMYRTCVGSTSVNTRACSFSACTYTTKKLWNLKRHASHRNNSTALLQSGKAKDMYHILSRHPEEVGSKDVDDPTVEEIMTKSVSDTSIYTIQLPFERERK